MTSRPLRALIRLRNTLIAVTSPKHQPLAPALDPTRLRGRKGHAKIGIITVVVEEFTEVQAILDLSIELPGTTPYYVASKTFSDNYDVVLMRLPGRGNINSSIGATGLMEDFRPPHILLVGIAGGVHGRDNTQLGDVVLPDFIEYYEMRKIADGQSRRRMDPYDHPSHRLRYQMAEPMSYRSDWLTRITAERRPVQDGNSPKVIIGNLIAGEKILGDNEDTYQSSILDDYDKAIAVDMESWGVAKAVYQMRATRYYDPQYLVIRGISDLVNEPGNDATRRQWRSYAAHVGAAFGSALIERILRDW